MDSSRKTRTTSLEIIDELPGGNEEVQSRIAPLTIPSHRHSIWYYFGWLTLFLLVVMAGTGILLAVYYVPDAAPAISDDGRGLATAIITADREWNGHPYRVGELLPLPYNPAGDSLEVPARLRGNVQIVRDSATGRPILPSAAWVSVEQTIMRDAGFGWLIRSVHSYSAGMLIAALFIHAASAFLMRAYRRPRQWMWYTGVVLLLLMLSFGFTGYLLPWNRLSYVATRVGVSYPEESLPLVGSMVAEVIRGGEDVGATTLTRLYAMHVVALPLAALLLVGIHVGLLHLLGFSRQEPVRRDGGIVSGAALGGASLVALIIYPVITGRFDPASPYAVVPLTMLPVATAYLLSTLAEGGRLRGVGTPYYRRGIYRDMIAWILIFGIILTIAVVAPWSRSGETALPVDLTLPLATPRGVHPEWYLMFAYQLLTVLPGGAAMAVLIVAVGLWLLLPVLDRGGRSGRRPMLVTALGVVLIAGAVALTIWGEASGR
jgi:quinol-cytochrome oxidoreductase complex cytochrome b subunit